MKAQSSDTLVKMNKRIEELAEQSGMTQYVAANNKYLERFAALLIDDIKEIIVESDTSPKMILHEPQRSIISSINDRFGDLPYLK